MYVSDNFLYMYVCVFILISTSNFESSKKVFYELYLIAFGAVMWPFLNLVSYFKAVLGHLYSLSCCNHAGTALNAPRL